MPDLTLSFHCGEDSLSVRDFQVEEAVSSPFRISVVAVSRNDDIDFSTIVGKPAGLQIRSGYLHALNGGARAWTGVCASMDQVDVEPTGLSTYAIHIVPSLWLLGHRRSHRIFQHRSIPDIVSLLLAEWEIEPAWRIDRSRYPSLEYKAQRGESDLAFVSRLLEEAGVAYVFEEAERGSRLVLSDTLGAADPRPPIPFVDNPNEASERTFVTRVRISNEVRPGAYTIRDHDFRNPGFSLFAGAPRAAAPEDRYEQYHYEPGAFLIETERGGSRVGDDKGVARHDARHGTERATRALEAERCDRTTVSFDTNATDLAPGVVLTIDHHPHPEVAKGRRLLMIASSLRGSPNGEWQMSGRAVSAEAPYRPRKITPKPRADGVESATVVGPSGQEIYTDELGRVRVQFPWDREGKSDDDSSCWMRVSQGWAGAGFGMMAIPRVGQEVLVGYLCGDPDQPIVVGRVHNGAQGVPYPLPEFRTRTTWKTSSSPGGGGYNEIFLDDAKGQELIGIQAEKDLRKLVKASETITVGGNRKKSVGGDETEITGGARSETTGATRTEVTKGDRITVIGGSLQRLVQADAAERTAGRLIVYVGGAEDVVVKQTRRELVHGDSHVVVRGKQNQRVEKTQSVVIGGDLREKVGVSHALVVEREIHLRAGGAIVIEAAEDLTLKGPGGFVRIDAAGVTIQGTVVKINSGGSAGVGHGAEPDEAEEAVEASVAGPS